MNKMLFMALLHTDMPDSDVLYNTLRGSWPIMWHYKIQTYFVVMRSTVEAAWFISYGMKRVYIASQILNSEHKLPNVHAHVPDIWHFTCSKNLEINSIVYNFHITHIHAQAQARPKPGPACH